MAYYFTSFPQTQYSQTGTGSFKKTITDITVRIKLRDIIKENIYSYYTVDITDEDTLEILAEKYYGDSEYHWVVAIANDIVDPQYDWPLNYLSFQNYINKKYGSVANAESQIHHYEKVISRRDSITGTITETVIEIQKADYDLLPSNSYEALNLDGGSTVEETITKRAITAMQFETDTNNAKRVKRLIKEEYLPVILEEFNNIMEDLNGSR